jgi:ATP:cob(I)alamin adenosyltransferase
MKIYTKTGDKGYTRLIGGKKVAKNDARVDGYGTLDELNAWIGLILAEEKVAPELASQLVEIQNILFDAGADLATPKIKTAFKVTPEYTEQLEKQIDQFVNQTPPIERFILPGGTPLAAKLHVARTIARRAERLISGVAMEEEINEAVLTWVNRLSDYFFVAARYVNHQAGINEPAYSRGGKVFHNE